MIQNSFQTSFRLVVQLSARSSKYTTSGFLECFPGFDEVIVWEFVAMPIAGLGSSFSKGCQVATTDIDLRASENFCTTIGCVEGMAIVMHIVPISQGLGHQRGHIRSCNRTQKAFLPHQHCSKETAPACHDNIILSLSLSLSLSQNQANATISKSDVPFQRLGIHSRNQGLRLNPNSPDSLLRGRNLGICLIQASRQAVNIKKTFKYTFMSSFCLIVSLAPIVPCATQY